MFYSKTTQGFYSPTIHGDNIPADAVEISDEHYQSLLDGQSNGLKIVGDENGLPYLFTPPPPTLAELKAGQVAATRALAEQHITAGYTSDALGTTHTYPSNRDYQLNIIGAAQTALPRTFLCADSAGEWARRMHTAAQLQQVCEDGAARMSDIFDVMDAIVASIEAAADQTALDAIDITTGWPA